jgi:hypothetical protein
LFHFKVKQNQASVLATFPLPIQRDNSEQQAGDNFEGLVCASKAANRYLLILGERGGHGNRGQLIAGELDLAAGDILWSNQSFAAQPPMPFSMDPGLRDIADLYLESNILWATAVREASDVGPFSSIIYQIALIDVQAAQPISMIASSQAFWQIDGFKVEALAAPSPLMPGSSLAIGTEDEHFHGQWRALFAPHGQSPVIPWQAPAAAAEPIAIPASNGPNQAIKPAAVPLTPQTAPSKDLNTKTIPAGIQHD